MSKGPVLRPITLVGVPGRRRAHFEPRYVLAALFLICLFLYLLMIPVPRVDGQLIGSDGVGYYIYVRSLVIDGDLDFANEYAHYRTATGRTSLTPIGRVANRYAVGAAVLWSPFFLGAHLVARAGQALGLVVAADGYGYLYQAAISVGSIVYGSLGFALSYFSARRLCSPAAALVATTLLWLASNAVYYMVFEPSMSHMVSMFSVALMLTIWFLRLRGAAQPSLPWAALLGASGGLVALARLQDALLLLVPYGYIALRCMQALYAGKGVQFRRWLAAGLLAGLATLLVFSPQLLVWQRLYGTWTTSPYVAEREAAFSWLQPQLGGVLFSTYHGLFSWHPIYLLATVGLLILAKRERWLAAALLAVLALDIYIVAAWFQWWQGDSFGGRILLNAMWIWVLGLAALIEWLRSRPVWYRPLLAAGVLLIVWNGLSLIQYRLGFVPMGEPLTWQQMTLGRLEVLWQLLDRL